MHLFRRLMISAACCLLLLQAVRIEAETWPAFRGKAGRGVSGETNLPVSWSAKSNLAWVTPLPGRGNSSPAVTSKRIYVTAQDQDKNLTVLAVDRKDGRIIWNRRVGDGALSTFGPKRLYAHQHNPATPSPVADDEHVWAFFGTGLLVCLDNAGTVKWKKNLAEKYGAYDVRFGMASSPRLWGNLLYVACMQKGPSYVLALDKRTGAQVWKTPRQLPAKDDGPDAYSSPVILQTKKRTELIVSGSDHVNSYDLRSGKQLWISSGLAIDSPYGRVIASPALSDDVIVVVSGHPLTSGVGLGLALKTGGTGDITSSHQLWRYEKFTPDSPSPVCYKGRIYMIRDDGVGSCLDLNSGAPIWKKRISGGPFHASAVAGDGKIYLVDIRGVCTVLEAGNEGKVLSRNKLDDTFYATPALSDGRIYLRGYRSLYAVGSR